MPRAINQSKGKKRGVPPQPIDWDEVDRLLMAHCSGSSIAHRLGICYDTLIDRCQSDKGVNFSEYTKQKRDMGVSLIKYTQFKLALEKDRSMLIWLGKQYCDQRDKHDIKQDIKQEISQKSILELPDNERRN